MKNLLILRHAKSSWSDPSMRDFDRPLDKRGEESALAMGRLIKDQDIIPDLIVSSPAKRAKKTAERVIETSSYDYDITWIDNLYGASLSSCIHIISKFPESTHSVLLIGHNPTLAELIENLTGTYHSVPTATLASISLPINKWCDVDIKTKGTLLNLWCPRELPAKYTNTNN